MKQCLRFVVDHCVYNPPGPTDEYDTSGRAPGLPRALIVAEDGTVHRYREPAGAAGSNIKIMLSVGKKAAGRFLDGREWNEFPEARP